MRTVPDPSPCRRHLTVNLEEWSKASIAAECGSAYRRYESELRVHYERYFALNPQLVSLTNRHSAKSLAAALPPGMQRLTRLIPRGSFHLHARSAKSSQMLALAVLGGAASCDPSLRWL